MKRFQLIVWEAEGSCISGRLMRGEMGRKCKESAAPNTTVNISVQLVAKLAYSRLKQFKTTVQLTIILTVYELIIGFYRKDFVQTSRSG